MQMISPGSARASRVDRGTLAPVGGRDFPPNAGDSTRPTRTARAGREANRCPQFQSPPVNTWSTCAAPQRNHLHLHRLPSAPCPKRSP